MDGPIDVNALLTAMLQWRVAWLQEQRINTQPPPICRAQAKKLKITYDSYKDYESTFVPLLMHEIWAQIFEESTRLECEYRGIAPMDVDDERSSLTSSNSIFSNENSKKGFSHQGTLALKRFHVGVLELKSENNIQLSLKSQLVVESNKLSNHLRAVGEGDLVRIDLVTELNNQAQTPTDYVIDVERNAAILTLFAYVKDVTTEKINKYTSLSDCFANQQEKLRRHHVINYSLIIAKRPLRLKLKELMKVSWVYYLKPMLRQIETIPILRESPLFTDILSPKLITCQLTVPTVVHMKSPHYNDMQYKAIIGTNEALVRNIPKIQLIQGPPGTGKTHTLIGIIKHFYTNVTNSVSLPKLLICAPSNGAIDEVARRLYKEREFLRGTKHRRTLRLVRVGHPDQISDSVKFMGLDELVEQNARDKSQAAKKRVTAQMQEKEEQLARYDTEIANLRYSNKTKLIPDIEMKIATAIKELEKLKQSEDLCARREMTEAAKRLMRFDLIRNADVILSTLNSCQRHPLDAMFKGDHPELSFHCVIVDEASQCCEPELLLPLCYGITKMILIGDPMQLPATVISRYAQDYDFGRSLFERFFAHFGHYHSSSPIAMLTEQYRMHPDICHFPSKQFYDGRLITARKISFAYPLKPYIVLDLKHGAETKSYNSSMENEVEAGMVRNLLMAVLTRAPEGSQVGVITPYKGQKRLITNKISSLQSKRRIKVDVNTCDGFQGQEKDIIILSCVRNFDAKGSIGFLKSFQRVNVALTRARHCLLVCISAKALTSDATWKSLITNATDRGCVQTFTHTPSPVALDNMICSSYERPSRPAPPVNKQREQQGYRAQHTIPPRNLKNDVEDVIQIDMDID